MIDVKYIGEGVRSGKKCVIDSILLGNYNKLVIINTSVRRGSEICNDHYTDITT